MNFIKASLIIILSLILSSCSEIKEEENISDSKVIFGNGVLDSSESKYIHLTVYLGNKISKWSTNTNSETLGEEIDLKDPKGINSIFKVQLKKANGGREIYSFNGEKNISGLKWKILSEACDGLCDSNVDNIFLKEDTEYVFIYE